MDNQAKFEQLYGKYRIFMYRVAYGLMKNRQDAEDAVQDAFVRIYDHIDDIGEVDSPRTRSFVMVVTRNICLNELRSRRHDSGEDLDELDAASDDSVEDTVLSALGVEEIKKALCELPVNYRDILYLTVFREYDLRGAAELLGITYENAKHRLLRARRKLAEMLDGRAVNL
ncbi:MAG: sigma-70 family RNA polymerase sigma factor [Oscillospiraceae bacterium]|nr:sigma-70 family RNA polymerase sigma factor [Oscillospiraceae bacterium]